MAREPSIRGGSCLDQGGRGGPPLSLRNTPLQSRLSNPMDEVSVSLENNPQKRVPAKKTVLRIKHD